MLDLEWKHFLGKSINSLMHENWFTSNGYYKQCNKSRTKKRKKFKMYMTCTINASKVFKKATVIYT